MRILSSISDRAKMSLQSFMAGFLPPPIFDLTLPIYWQPFNFEIDHKQRIIHANTHGDPCPVYEQELINSMTTPTPEIARWLETDQGIIEDIAQRLGATINTLFDILLISDSIRTQMEIELSSVPQWVIDAYHETFEKYSILLKIISNATPKMIQLSGGPILTEIVTNMEKIASKDPSAKKVMIYSGHDSTVANLAYALGVQDQIPEPINLADTIMVDLVQNGNGEPKVQAFYLDKGNVIPRTIKLNVPAV